MNLVCTQVAAFVVFVRQITKTARTMVVVRVFIFVPIKGRFFGCSLSAIFAAMNNRILCIRSYDDLLRYCVSFF